MTEMKLRVVAPNIISGLRQLGPENESDLPLFMHVTGGSEAVTEDLFFDEFFQIFKAHNVNCVFSEEYVLSIGKGDAAARASKKAGKVEEELRATITRLEDEAVRVKLLMEHVSVWLYCDGTIPNNLNDVFLGWLNGGKAPAAEETMAIVSAGRASNG
jgi:hypothetical protein